MLKKLFLAVLAISLVIGILVYIKFNQFAVMGEAGAKMVLPPQTVTAMSIEKTEWEQVSAANGTVSAVQGVTVSAEVGGRVTNINFESADSVTAGQMLLQ
ncbi:MAG: efflux transporter periplasmic adaptor subunit, partial [Gammaproteobacteria bacterium]